MLRVIFYLMWLVCPHNVLHHSYWSPSNAIYGMIVYIIFPSITSRSPRSTPPSQESVHQTPILFIITIVNLHLPFGSHHAIPFQTPSRIRNNSSMVAISFHTSLGVCQMHHTHSHHNLPEIKVLCNQTGVWNQTRRDQWDTAQFRNDEFVWANQKVEFILVHRRPLTKRPSRPPNRLVSWAKGPILPQNKNVCHPIIYSVST